MTGEVEIAQEFLQVLLQTERTEEQELQAYQSRVLKQLVDHAYENVPFYSLRRRPEGALSSRSETWQQLSFMSRSDLVAHDHALRTRGFPKSHGIITTAHTGGSTGPPARRDLSSLEALARFAASYRMFSSWGLNQELPLYWLRRPMHGMSPLHDRWGFPWLNPNNLGNRYAMDVALPAADQLHAMRHDAPVYVNTLPSNIGRLCHKAQLSDIGFSIPHIISVAEYLAPEFRVAAADTFGSRIIDVYSSAEAGVIAVECPESGLYHIQSELVLVEIVREDGHPCETGEVGEVVVTPLYSYATPLLRYRSGDFVEKGPRCSCGRTLPTISRIAGRREHMFDFDDGKSYLPPIDRVGVTRALGHDHWVLVQTELRRAELRIAGSIDPVRNKTVIFQAHKALPQSFDVTIRNVEALPLTSGSKRHFTLNALPRS